jgi:hypothetical protein
MVRITRLYSGRWLVEVDGRQFEADDTPMKKTGGLDKEMLCHLYDKPKFKLRRRLRSPLNQVELEDSAPLIKGWPNLFDVGAKK